MLERGRPSRLSRRGRRLATVLVLVAALAAGAADWKVRRTESAEVDRCVESALSAIAYADGRLGLMSSYVSPALASAVPDAVHRGLLRMISGAAVPATPPVSRARERCVSVSVVPTHTGLRRTRADCVRLLESELTYLAAVVEDGRQVFVGRGTARGRCSTR